LPNAIKNCPNGKISPNLVTLHITNLEQSILETFDIYDLGKWFS
jgi:hypothetical protein